jgi:acetylornithine deacetylase/succinyl-diaminopimelate desuccinylase-like protein
MGHVESRPMDETWRGELSEFIAIPSVSADLAHREDVKRAGEWVRDFIRRIGGTAELTPFGEKELALGDIPASTDPESAPTVLCYGHFDVQPPAPLDLWESDPFELTIKDDWAYARGIADDKGQLFILLKAAQKLVEANALPVNLRFACDGEEEIGGHTIVDYLATDDRGADAGIIFDGGMVRMDIPAFGLATRGLIAFDVKVKTGERDLHSGMYGGAALNAIHVLLRLFDAVLAGPNGLLPEPLRQGIAAPTPAELKSWEALPSGEDELSSQGARPLDPDAAAQFNIRTLAEPSADVNGILGGKPGLRNTTLSVHASGEITIRLAPGQDLQTIGAAAEKLMRAAAPPGAEVDIAWAGAPPGLMKPDSPAVQLGLKAFERVLGVKPLLVRSGGTLPIVPALADRGIQTVLTGFALPESNVHSPNERFLVRYFAQGVETAAALYTEYKDLPKA